MARYYSKTPAYLPAKPKILVIDDDQSMLDLAQYHLREQKYEVVTASTGTGGLSLLGASHFDLVLTDLNLPDLDGIELVTQIKAVSPDTEIIMISGYGSVFKAVEATKAGAFFFVEKPVDFDELLLLIDKALERTRLASEIKHLRGRLATRDSYQSIIGSSKAMQHIYEIIESVAESDANVLIHGESGTGKELVANAIHFRSLRANKAFIKVNCAALPKELMESELFGHTKGAFTGAMSETVGLIGQANGGSLLMDEIGEMPLELQPKLMRVLQERVYTQVGGERPLAANFRLIAATNREPAEAIQSGILRKDLYYRINTIEIRVPPLRERPEDIQHLAECFLADFALRYHRLARAISPQAYAQLFAHLWSGNVRELQNIMERAVLVCKGETIDVQDLPFQKDVTVSPVPSVTLFTPATGELSIEQLGRILVAKLPDPKSLDEERPDVLKEIECAVVIATLERTKGNKQAAANLLGLYRPRLYNLLRKYNLSSSSTDDPLELEEQPGHEVLVSIKKKTQHP
ncbi:MAG: sigma-54-dependent Fis family transcriptional regulator [Acidobacteria bacterium]|nr:sigma-54-dependent Fis family transcriptional regulator [Acidobacteriota bacterium]